MKFLPSREQILIRFQILAVGVPAACLLLLLPTEYWVVELLRHFRIWCGVLAVLLLLILPFLRPTRLPLWAGLTAATAIWQLWPVFAWRSPPKEEMAHKALPAAGKVSVLTFNLLYGNKEVELTTRLLAENLTDVVLLQEFTPEWQSQLQGTFQGYPHRFEMPQEGVSGLAIYSKFPLKNRSSLGDEGMDVVLLANAEITPKTDLGIMLVHPNPPVGSEATRLWQRSIADWPQRLKSVSPTHQAVAGDCNATPFCRTLQRFLKEADLRDSSLGHGFGNSWNLRNLPPFGLPIDHIFVSPKIRVTSRSVGPSTGSDHRWVRAELELLAAE